ncbi:uncharacterized protein [Henckelia pumila]|uniref:uncharacterized protein n=1 Tax=Henckelia pumila TaxID=405737 RepID=UPI003C6E41BC
MGSESSSAQYIHMVHHLIEVCIIFKMGQEECMEALYKHANIKTVITSTVWKELEKENKEFFEAYTNRRDDEKKKLESTKLKLTSSSSSTQHMANHDEASSSIIKMN